MTIKPFSSSIELATGVRDIQRAIQDQSPARLAETANRLDAFERRLNSHLGDLTTNVNLRDRMFVGRNTAVSVPSWTWTTLPIDTELYDPHGWHTGSSTAIVPDIPGWYTANASVRWPTVAPAPTRVIVAVTRNGSLATSNLLGYIDIDGIGGHPRIQAPAQDFKMNGTTENVQVRAWHNSGSSKDLRVEVSVRLVNPV